MQYLRFDRRSFACLLSGDVHNMLDLYFTPRWHPHRLKERDAYISKHLSWLCDVDVQDIFTCLEQCGSLIQFLDPHTITYKLYCWAVEHDGNALQFVPEQTEELCLLAVRENYKALQWVEHQTTSICWAALYNDSDALYIIAEPSLGMCGTAVSSHGESVLYVPEKLQSKKLWAKAIATTPYAVRYLERFSSIECDELYRLAINKL